MPTTANLIGFTLVALGMALTPGPNMIYLISRSITQGPRAGLVSLIGTAACFVVYMLLAAFGITAIVMAVPFAYDVLRFAGALYLLYLAWQAIRPGGRSPFQVRDLPVDPPAKLFAMGFLTNALNPKAAVLYLSLLPQFMTPENGNVLGQAIILGFAQIAMSVSANTLAILAAGSIATFLAKRPSWMRIQRWMMATVLGALAVRMATEARR